MRKIPLRHGDFESKTIFVQVLGMSPARGMNVAEMRSRIKLIDKIENNASDTEVSVSENEFTTLKDALESFPFNIAHVKLLEIIDDVLECKEDEN